MTAAVLVVEDHESAALGLAAPLRGRYEVTIARTVAEALAALAAGAFACVVLDLLLDAPAAELHRALLLRRTPVVVVSGLEADAARTIARVWGAPSLLKPCTDTELLAAVDRAAARNAHPETPPMPEAPPHTPTMAPPPPAEAPAPLPAPPAPADVDSISPLAATDRDVAIAEAKYRTRRRLAATLTLAALTVLFELRGHTVPVVLVVAITALGIGIEGAIKAARTRPGVAAGGAAGVALLALGGTLLDLDGANAVATLGAGAIPLADLLADRVRS